MKLPQKINPTLIIIAILTFLLGWQFGHIDLKLEWNNFRPTVNIKNQQPLQSVQNLDFKLFWDTWDLVSKEYVDKKALDPKKMYYGAIQGMVAAIGDPYTVFLPPEAQKNTQEELGGSFDGVGIQLGFNKDKRLVVQTPLDGTPADKAGIKAGDLILKINDKDATALSLPDAVNLIRGPKGSKVTLEIYREGEDKPFEVSLQRDTIIVKSAEFSTKETLGGKKIGVIKLSRFGERTFAEWSNVVSEALASGSEGLILDLRNNPGGFLDGATFIGSEFIPKLDQKGNENSIVLQENSKGERHSYKVSRDGKLLRMPLLVLINKGSASASEIVAGAIQDFNRGKLIGEQSFGKGTIQDSKELSGGTGIHITTAKWLTPKGRWIHDVGLTPDTKVEAGDDKTKDPQMDKALEEMDQ